MEPFWGPVCPRLISCVELQRWVLRSDGKWDTEETEVRARRLGESCWLTPWSVKGWERVKRKLDLEADTRESIERKKLREI